MMSIGRVAIAGHLGIHAGTPRPGMLIFFQNENTSAFTHDKTIPLFIKRPRGMLRVIVSRAESSHGAKPSNTNSEDRGLRSACEHYRGVSHLERAPGFTQCVVCGSARGASREVGTPQIEVH